PYGLVESGGSSGGGAGKPPVPLQNNAIPGYSNAIGNGPGFTTQGWWTGPNGLPTGVAGNAQGAGAPPGQGGGGSWVDGKVFYPNTPGVVTVAAFPSIWVPNINPFDFRPGDISTLGLNSAIAWQTLHLAFTDTYVLP